MTPLKNPSFDQEDDLEADDPEPQSTVRAKSKPSGVESQLQQIAADCEAGVITPDEAVEYAIAVNSEFASKFMSPERREELELLLREMFDTDPTLLRLMGRGG